MLILSIPGNQASLHLHETATTMPLSASALEEAEAAHAALGLRIQQARKALEQMTSEAALDKMDAPATPFVFRVHFPVVNPKTKTYNLILGLEKMAKFAPDRVYRRLGMSPLFLSLRTRGLMSTFCEGGDLPWAPGACTQIKQRFDIVHR